uniref:Uncharacterized protein n=1 Tax=Paramoeba aestuarina TaxID=180227 RepID=A0A6U2WBY5_9EUKA|mmetsp:Transcript_14523/g.22676  ORF Transcript_14523/g.22676 Transcript_14523/m.22676 type:complete len:282 (+) Transcript_14523:365-1210(+)
MEVDQRSEDQWKKISGGKMTCAAKFAHLLTPHLLTVIDDNHEEGVHKVLYQTSKQIPHGDDPDPNKKTCLISLEDGCLPTTIYLIPKALWSVFLSLPPWQIEDVIKPFQYQLERLNKGDFVSFPSYFIHHSPPTTTLRKLLFYYSITTGTDFPTDETQKNPWSVALDSIQKKDNFAQLPIDKQLAYMHFLLMYDQHDASQFVLGREGSQGINVSMKMWVEMRRQVEALKPEGLEGLSKESLEKLQVLQLKELGGQLGLNLNSNRTKAALVKAILQIVNDTE